MSLCLKFILRCFSKEKNHSHKHNHVNTHHSETHTEGEKTHTAKYCPAHQGGGLRKCLLHCSLKCLQLWILALEDIMGQGSRERENPISSFRHCPSGRLPFVHLSICLQTLFTEAELGKPIRVHAFVTMHHSFKNRDPAPAVYSYCVSPSPSLPSLLSHQGLQGPRRELGLRVPPPALHTLGKTSSSGRNPSPHLPLGAESTEGLTLSFRLPSPQEGQYLDRVWVHKGL